MHPTPQRGGDRSIPLTILSSLCPQLPAPAPRSLSPCPSQAGAPSSASSPPAPPALTALMSPPGVPQQSRSSTWCHHQLSWHRACARPGPPRPPRPGPATRTMRWRHQAGATSVPLTTSTRHCDQHSRHWDALSGGEILETFWGIHREKECTCFFLLVRDYYCIFCKEGGNFSLLYGCAPSRWPVKGPLIVVFVVLMEAFSLLFTQCHLCLHWARCPACP